MSKTMLLRPRVSEKAYGMSQIGNTYIFEVPKAANKLTIAEAIRVQYGVEVASVNVALIKGKAKRSYRKRGGRSSGRDNDIKKAYISLKAGQSIDVFPAEEAEKPAPKAKKGAK